MPFRRPASRSYILSPSPSQPAGLAGPSPSGLSPAVSSSSLVLQLSVGFCLSVPCIASLGVAQLPVSDCPMSSLVSDFILNPVLRHARRFSEISRSTLTGDDEHTPTSAPAPEDVVSHQQETTELPQTPPSSRPPSASATDDTATDNTATDDNMTDRAVASTPVAEPLFPAANAVSPPIANQGQGIPEDDGKHELRCRIQAINARDIVASQKARLMHEALLEPYRASQAAALRDGNDSARDTGPAAQTWEHRSSPRPLDPLRFWHGQFGDTPVPDKFVLSESDVTPTYAPIRQPKSPGGSTPTILPSTPADLSPPLGCQHYERNVKLQCSTCLKWYTCRFCHDSREEHSLIRRETRHMLCMLCGTPQRASDVCVGCGETAAQYYCNICKLWENRQSKPIYHCSDCGICRRGLGLGKDFFHCKTCRACITTSIQSSHKCIERSTDCDCPICGEYMFTSPKPVVFMSCGHSIHKKCYDQHMKVSYKCPICNKSLANMETQFRNLDVAIQSQPMPPEFRDTQATVLCNDCSGRSTVAYHWLGLKCSICRSYNTVELRIHGEESEQVRAAVESLEPPVAAAAAESNQDTTRSAALSMGSHSGGALLFNRRRHSSHNGEPVFRVTGRVARSLSPLGMSMDHLCLTPMTNDADSEDDILGFWGGTHSEDDSDDQGESDSDQDDDASAADGDDEEDDEDEIILIGHR
ncbi:hypothetical protein XA68_15540 [Ophiocordyceps unilateralis]|uniref:RING-type domain-containing protein n=1 Tax=Ophiocordyceps unilateralis TaxID=268505 RepID=A0A2A9PKV2_OPHUN|nr:hypothetical protein XA68_15540 [Ophiocordyceps unilateralis]